MHHVAHTAEIDVPASVCFDYVNDFDNVPKWCFGVKAFSTVGPSEPRLGTILEGTVQYGPAKLKMQGEIVAYTEGELIALRIEQGPITGVMTWRFTPTATGFTSLTAEVAYGISNNIAGRTIARIIDTILDPAIKHTESKLRQQVIALHADADSREH